MNWNVRLAYIQTISSAIGMGIVQVAFAVYVNQILEQVNFVLGVLHTTSGFASTIFVFPSGYLADKYRRDILIRMSVFFGIVSQIALVFSTTLLNADIILIILFIAQALAGIGWGLSGPAAQALLADSIESGDRSRIFANMHLLSFVAAAIGPFFAAGLTFIIGNTWDLETLKNLIVIGAIGTTCSYISIAFASDDKALISKIEQTSAPRIEKESMIEDFPIMTLFGRSFSYDVIIPILIVTSGIIIGFGAGATVAFFPILFANPAIGYGLQPFFTYVIFGVTNIISGITGIFAQRIIPIFGRIGSMFLSQGFAIICLLGLVANLVLYQENYISFDISIALLVI
ncbi:MAG: MFS transporter, partial [Candidatus Hodarchaeota archaeon]